MSNLAKRKRGGMPFGVPFRGPGRPRTYLQKQRYSTDQSQLRLVAPTTPLGTGNVTSVLVGSGTGLTLNKPVNVSDKDVLVAVVWSSLSGATWSLPSGWSQQAISNTSRSLAVHTKPIPVAASESATSYTFNHSGGTGRSHGILFRLVGGPQSGIVDVVGAETAGSASSIVLPAITPVAEQSLLLGVWGAAHTTTSMTLTPPASMTEIGQNTQDVGAASTIMVASEPLFDMSGISTGTRAAAVSPSSDSSVNGFMLNLSPGEPVSQTNLQEGWGMPIY